METKMVGALKPGDGNEAIEIRVIRRWASRRNEYCYIFIDKNGDAIQAAGNLNDKSYFDSQIEVNKSYRVTNYICQEASNIMKTVPHNTTIKIGKAAAFEEISTNDFPAYYFSFLEYHQLPNRLYKHEILTDYIGRIEHVTDVKICKGIPLRKITLEDLSGNTIEATFWDETAHSFNKQAVTELPDPVIAAVTSMKVTEYRGIQLTGTPASHIYINPEINEAQTMAAQ